MSSGTLAAMLPCKQAKVPDVIIAHEASYLIMCRLHCVPARPSKLCCKGDAWWPKFASSHIADAHRLVSHECIATTCCPLLCIAPAGLETGKSEKLPPLLSALHGTCTGGPAGIFTIFCRDEQALQSLPPHCHRAGRLDSLHRRLRPCNRQAPLFLKENRSITEDTTKKCSAILLYEAARCMPQLHYILPHIFQCRPRPCIGQALM